MASVKYLITLALCFCITLPAQVDRASLTGTVTDASGASVADAAVTVESSSMGLRRESRSSASGTYQIPGLIVGVYTVSIGKVGFNTLRFDNVVLAVGQTRTLDAQIPVGAVSTAVEIIAAATPLDQTNAEIGTVIGEQQIRNIPLNGRHWASLMALAPGAVNVGEGNQNAIRLLAHPAGPSPRCIRPQVYWKRVRLWLRNT